MSSPGEGSSDAQENNDDNSSLCVEFHKNSSVALTAMKKLVAANGDKMEKYMFFPLDDRIFNAIQLTDQQYQDFSIATMWAFENAAAPQTCWGRSFSTGRTQLHIILFGTKDGILYCINKNEQIHKRLRLNCNLLKTNVAFMNPSTPVKLYFERICGTFAIICLPEYQCDGTHLRRARCIKDIDQYSLFLELDTGTIRMIHTKYELKTSKILKDDFFQSSCITQYKLDKSNDMKFQDILKKMLVIAKTRELSVLRYEPFDYKCSMPIVEVIGENVQEIDIASD